MPTAAQILSLGVRSNSRQIRASDTGVVYHIPRGGSGADAKPLVRGDGVGVSDRPAFRGQVGMQHSLDPRDFGTVTTGAGVSTEARTANTAAINAAITAAAASGADVQLPSARIELNGPLNIAKNGQCIIGQGVGRTILKQTANAANLIVLLDDPGTNTNIGTRIKGVEMEGNGAGSSTGAAIFANASAGANYNGSDLLVDQCWIEGFGTGIFARFFDVAEVKNTPIYACATGVDIATTANSWKFDTCAVSSCAVEGFKLDSGNFVLVNCEQGNQPKHMTLGSNGVRVLMIGGNAESYSGAAGITMGTNAQLEIRSLNIAQGAGETDTAITMAAGSKLHLAAVNFSGFSASTPFITAANVFSCGITADGATLHNVAGLTNPFVSYNGEYFTGPSPFVGQRDDGSATPSANNRGVPFWLFNRDANGQNGQDQLKVVIRRSGAFEVDDLLNSTLRSGIKITGTSGALAVNQRVEPNDPTVRTQRLLPLNPKLGDEIPVVVYGAAGFRVNHQPTSSTTIMLPDGSESTAGAAGYITAEKGASFILRCMFTSGQGYWQVTNASGTIAKG